MIIVDNFVRFNQLQLQLHTYTLLYDTNMIVKNQSHVCQVDNRAGKHEYHLDSHDFCKSNKDSKHTSITPGFLGEEHTR
ncbi:hypothetical protein NARC_60105 [Candidatus Nitrosocosmicus arcticus]|uniref:Uncharacterized protein n=1 Tax=Candidatus Nitrosocosmicus arcticus TaxID=2035267 RepID=A0A557SVT4_9ARCH|nr:hypothetical protein NARC_60105 [Candidatus Nitrosocosmicus arcticus]